MTYRNIGWSIIAGLASSALFAMLAKGGVLSTVGIYLSPVPLIMAGLAFGFFGSLIAGIVGQMFLPVMMAGGAVVLYSLCDVLPCLVLVFLALRGKTDNEGNKKWYPIGYLISWISVLSGIFALFTVMFVSASIALQGGEAVGIPESLRILFNQATDIALGNNGHILFFI